MIVWVRFGKIVYIFFESRVFGVLFFKNVYFLCYYLIVIIFMQLNWGYQMEGKNFFLVFDFEDFQSR